MQVAGQTKVINLYEQRVQKGVSHEFSLVRASISTRTGLEQRVLVESLCGSNPAVSARTDLESTAFRSSS